METTAKNPGGMPDMGQLALDALAREAYARGLEAGRAEAAAAAFAAGTAAGSAAASASVRAASEVTGAWFRDGRTVLEFADGTKSKVRYDPRYGYPYDPEKGILCAMLKRLTGSRYVSALRAFGTCPAALEEARRSAAAAAGPCGQPDGGDWDPVLPPAAEPAGACAAPGPIDLNDERLYAPGQSIDLNDERLYAPGQAIDLNGEPPRRPWHAADANSGSDPYGPPGWAPACACPADEPFFDALDDEPGFDPAVFQE